MNQLSTVFVAILFPGIVSSQNPQYIGTLDFDNTPENCEVIFDTSSTNIWQIGTPQKPFFGNAYSNPHAILTDTINPYPISNHSSFTLKFANNTLYTEGWNFTSISLWHKFQMDTLHDFGKIYWSPDTSDVWFPMIDTCGISLPAYAIQWECLGWSNQLGNNNWDNFVTGTQDWTYSSYDWIWYLPVGSRDDLSPDTIYVRFDFDSDSAFESFDGWMIDDIAIEKAAWSGINEMNGFHDNIKAYPSPASTILYFALEGSDRAARATLINFVGAIVKSIELNSNQGHFDVENLTRGMYMLMIENTDGKHKIANVVLK